jgi:hypothetical protein
MKLLIILLGSFLGFCSPSIAQAEATASKGYFPADLEFPELQTIISEETFENPDHLSKIEDGHLIDTVGFEKYARRQYSLKDSGVLTVEAVTLIDFRAAYSLLTLLRGTAIQEGPPGDVFTAGVDGIRFAQGKHWIRIQYKGASEDLVRRVAVSISKRIGPRQASPPSLVSRFPKQGYDASSLKYFPSMSSFEFYVGSDAASLHISSDAEIAQARYIMNDQQGLLFLLKFPTIQMAEDYYSDLANGMSPRKDAGKIYAKRAGPIVAILKGSQDPESADKILGPLRYSYSVRWIFEQRNKSTIVWGIPVKILGTVVKSLFFVALLCVISVTAGACFAVLRFAIRNHFSKNAPDQPEQAEILRLRLR